MNASVRRRNITGGISSHDASARVSGLPFHVPLHPSPKLRTLDVKVERQRLPKRDVGPSCSLSVQVVEKCHLRQIQQGTHRMM